MSTHRSASLGPPAQDDPRTPPQFIPKRTVSTEPKSDYLRGVLESRRPRGSLTPSPAPPPAPVPESLPHESDDEWAPTDEGGQRQSVMTRHLRRLSIDAPTNIKTPHRQKTRAELEKDKDKTEKNAFTVGLRLVLLEEQNAKLVKELEEARELLEELDDVQDENRELREERNMMELKLQNVDTVLASKDDDIAELMAINEETIKEMEKRDTGLEEAADIILSLEEENLSLRQRLENARPTTAATVLSDYSSIDDDKRLQNRASLASIAESKLSSSGHHSDYYSQPGSPQVEPSKTPSPKKKIAGPQATKVRNMIHANSKGNGSVSELRKRISYVSLTDRDSMSSFQDAVSTVPSLPNIKAPTPRRINIRVETQLRAPTSSETLPLPSPRRTSLHAAPLALRDRFHQDQTSRMPPSPTMRRGSGAPSPVLTDGIVPPRANSKDFTRRSSSSGLEVAQISSELEPPPSPPDSSVTDFSAPPQNWWQGYQRFTAQQALPRPVVTRTSTAPNLFNPGEDEHEFMDRMKFSSARRR